MEMKVKVKDIKDNDMNKPLEIGNSDAIIFYCSKCDFPKNDTLTFDMKYCWNCGVKLDWSDWE